jgi:ankyrin repeat protein
LENAVLRLTNLRPVIFLLLLLSINCNQDQRPAQQTATPVNPSPGNTLKDSSALITAAGTGDLDQVRDLLDAGADVNVKGAGGRTPLMEACYAGHTQVVRVLLDNGANVSLKKSDGATALAFAEGGKHQEIIQMLEQVGQLLTASGKGDLKEVKTLIDKGTCVNARGVDGRTALMEAAYGGHTEVVRLLLEKGADVTTIKDDGATALSLTQDASHRDIHQMLLDKGAK